MITLRRATLADAPLLASWDKEPHVIESVTDDDTAETAFAGAVWDDEITSSSDDSFYLIAEHDGRPIGAMQVMDPHREPEHYWGEIEPNLRSLDIWIGEADMLGQGHGTEMMRHAIELCFATPSVTAIVIDPLSSNPAAHRFYQRLGFVPEGQRFFGEDDCLVHRLTRDGWHRVARDSAPAAR